jgi:hypothetical protein
MKYFPPKYYHLLCVAICLLLTGALYAQKPQQPVKPVRKPGQGKILKDTLYWGTVYFSNAPFEFVKVAQLWVRGFANIRSAVDSMHKDAIFVTIDNLHYSIDSSTHNMDGYGYAIHRPSNNYEKASQEYNALKTQTFDSGTISFSGYPFLTTVTANAKDITAVRANLNKCRYGPVITLTDCYPKNANGSLGLRVNKVLSMK